MKSFVKIRLAVVMAVLAVGAMLLPGRALAQVTAKVHGKVNNAAGQVVPKGDVKFTTDKVSDVKDRKYAYSFPLDANGMFKGDKVVSGDYRVVVVVDDKNVDYQDVVIKPGDDATINFDMTRAEYLKQLKPEELAAIEENKKHNAGVIAENAKIANINTVLTQARTDEKAGKAADAVAALKPLADARPTESVIWAALGEAELAAGDDAVKAAKKAGSPSNTPEIYKNYEDSIVSYQKAIDTQATSKKPSAETVGSCYINMGQGYAKTGKLKEAAASYESAVKANPAAASMAYFNEAAVFFNAHQSPEAAAAADKAIAVDPKRPELYYIKGQSLVGGATEDPKTHKFVLPPGCLEAYQSYLELAPDGAHAAEVKALLDGLGQAQKSSFKAGKK